MPAVTSPERPSSLYDAAAHWQLAFDTAQRATELAITSPVHAELAGEQLALHHERVAVATELEGLARMCSVVPGPRLPQGRVTARDLGLPAGTSACILDLDGVLTDSSRVHAEAWRKVLDEFLLRLSARTRLEYVAFDTDGDYEAYLEGRLRLDGIRAFLAARGIRLAEENIQALATRKAAVLQRALHHGISALPGARRFLETSGYARIGRAVLSASTSTTVMLELAGLDQLVDVRIDADVLRDERLRAQPAPDAVLAACERLGTAPARAVTVTHMPAGVAAGRAAGTTVVGIAARDGAELLSGFGAHRVVPSLAALLDARLRSSADRR